MKQTFLLLSLFLIGITSCNNSKKTPELSHLSDANYIKSNPISDKFGDYKLYERMEFYKIPGINISVVKNGKLVWNQAYGICDTENNKKVDTLTLFQAGSISKPIAALGILKLADQGLIDLDENVNSYLKGYKIPENEFTKNTKVTLRAILSHTAGLNVSGIEGYAHNKKLPTTEEQISGKGNFERIVAGNEPNTTFSYSGGGYIIAQKVIEDVTGKSIEEYMHREFFEPWDMKMTTFKQPLPSKYLSNVSTGYGVDGSMIEGKWQVFPSKAAAGLWTIPSDLAKYCIELQKIYNSEKEDGILSREIIEEMFSNPYSLLVNEEIPPALIDSPDDYWGLGPIMIGSKDNLIFKHGGSNAGFKSNYTAFVNKGDAIIIMTNGDNGYSLIYEIEKVLSDYYKMGIH